MTKQSIATAAASLFLTTNLSASPAESTTARAGTAKEAVEAPIIDGKVEEEIWKEAEVFTDFIQTEPHEGEPATENTEVRVLYDDNAIYIGVICFDRDPEGIIISDTRRDSDLSNMDAVQGRFGHLPRQTKRLRVRNQPGRHRV